MSNQYEILATTFKDGDTKLFYQPGNLKLLVSYSTKRATKDAINRERGLSRLEKQLGKRRLTKNNINYKGCNKYLKLSGTLNISIDYEKYKADVNWDGLKGYVSNSALNTNEILENYNQLWQIEKHLEQLKQI